jgi:hAT family C-terminal dimerisation region
MAERHTQRDINLDELDQYLRTPTVINLSLKPISWWLEPTQQSTFPNLSRMAIDILSIPVMSAEPERLFSSAKITITDRRNQLKSDIIEALECLQSWYDIPSVDNGLSFVQFNQLNDFTEGVEELTRTV